MGSRKYRHILSLSGGKDSAALAVYLHDKVPNLEYVFLDTGYELPETYDFLKMMQEVLKIKIDTVNPKRNFKYWLKRFNGCLPSPQNRWCTKHLKIKPYEEKVGDEHVISYIGLRADENRSGYINHSNNIVPMYPFIEDNITKKDVINILIESGLGLPKYYSWRSRSGCYFCFFQRRFEWIGLHDNHNDLFELACKYEENHSDGRNYTWVPNESLRSLIKRRKEIEEANSIRATKDKSKNKKLTASLRNIKTKIGRDDLVNNQAGKLNVSENILDNALMDEEGCIICTK